MENFKYKKSFGQNFLQDKNVIHQIVDKTNIDNNSLVIEVGPGSGALTSELARVANNVLSYEIDERLEETLDENLREFNNIEIIFDDFLNRNIRDDIKEYNYDSPEHRRKPVLDKAVDMHSETTCYVHV